MDRPTDAPLFHFLCRKRQNRENLRQDLPKQQSHLWGEKNRGVAIETLKEKMDALEEADNCFIARDNIFYCLSQVLCAHTSGDMREDIPREGLQFR